MRRSGRWQWLFDTSPRSRIALRRAQWALHRRREANPDTGRISMPIKTVSPANLMAAAVRRAPFCRLLLVYRRGAGSRTSGTKLGPSQSREAAFILARSARGSVERKLPLRDRAVEAFTHAGKGGLTAGQIAGRLGCGTAYKDEPGVLGPAFVAHDHSPLPQNVR